MTPAEEAHFIALWNAGTETAAITLGIGGLMTEGISETVSEKKRRGRPPRFTAEEMGWLAEIHKPERRSKRGLQNFSYEARTQGILESLVPTYPELKWIYDHEAIMRGGGTYRHTVMEALGRIESDAVLVEVAKQLCEWKPRAREAVALIRRFRKVQKPVNLTEALRRTLNTYLRAHPELTLVQARDAVAELWRLIDHQIES